MDRTERDLRIQLEGLLYEILDDEEFVDGIFSEMETAQDVRAVINYIESGIDVDSTQVSLLSIDIGKAHGNVTATS